MTETADDNKNSTVTDTMETKNCEESTGKELAPDEQMSYEYGQPQEQKIEENCEHIQSGTGEEASDDTQPYESENKFAYHDNHYEDNYRNAQDYTEQNPQNETSPMDLKDWVLTLVVLMIPCVGIVMYFVWAFGDKGNINRRNFCRAQLIIFGVLLVIYLIFFLLFGTVLTRTVIYY